MFKWMNSIDKLDEIKTRKDRQDFLLNLVCFAACVEGLFFFGAFAYVYFLRSKGMLNGLAAGTNWVFRDESCHINFAFEVIATARKEDPTLFDNELKLRVGEMLREAVDVEMAFAEDVLSFGVAGLSARDMRQYLEFIADQRLKALGIHPMFEAKNPLGFMELQDVQELANFFERRVSAYQTGVTGTFGFTDEF